VHHFLTIEDSLKENPANVQEILAFSAKRGLPLVNPAQLQDFVIMSSKLGKMMYFYIIIGSRQKDRPRNGQKDQIRARSLLRREKSHSHLKQDLALLLYQKKVEL